MIFFDVFYVYVFNDMEKKYENGNSWDHVDFLCLPFHQPGHMPGGSVSEHATTRFEWVARCFNVLTAKRHGESKSPLKQRAYELA